MAARTADNMMKKVKSRGPWGEVWRRLKRNRMALIGLAILLAMVLLAIFADVVAPYGMDDQDPLERAFLSPSLEFPFGTDNLGRDILSRVIFGARISLQVGIIAVGISFVFGCVFGAIAGYYGNTWDNIIMRLMDTLLAIPGILLAITIAATLGPGIINAMMAVGLSGAPGFARVVRASVLTVRGNEYVEAARAVNASDFRIITKHIMPNILAPVIVQATLSVANAILMAAALSFLGLGVQPPIPEWGAMLSQGRLFLRDYPHVVIFPATAIMLTVFGLNLFGDGLRDALDPRLKR
ncbi:MAG: ABC transporter permease [Planctomycetota bacterium]|jgi:peptide/nickel transport system permease protein|nr:ABC transporter permease [Planctomycetota bacterium]